MRKYVDGMATFNQNPMDKATAFLQARASEKGNFVVKAKSEFVTPMKLRKIRADVVKQDQPSSDQQL